MIRRLLITLCFIGCFTLIACGGGSSSTPVAVNPPPNNPPVGDPFGLTMRTALASFDLPLAGTALGDFNVVAAFENLSFSAALFVAGVPNQDRLVVVEQGGRIIAFDNDDTTTSTQLILDLSARVVFAGEQGLLGLAFDPNFAQNGYFYLHYSTASLATPINPSRSVISRMTWDNTTDLVDTATEKIILEIEQPFSNHNGGMLAFGPDGYLYIAMGDGGSGGDPLNNAQDLTSLLGKMLRIDVDPQNQMDAYDIPLDNPFVATPSARPEIYASGLRNPFRFSFDRQSGELWLGDVGQNSLEEIDIILAGSNYGWRVLEGTQNFDASANTLPLSAFTPPVFEYGRSEGIAVIGGYVYRGSQFASLFGRYLYSDFGSGTVWALTYNGTAVTANDPLDTAPGPTSFGEDNAGELLIVSRNAGLYRLEANGGFSSAPSLLSETGIFTDLVNLTPAAGLIEYTPNQPFWSDGVDKRRWLGIPDNTQISFTNDNWTLPIGSVTVKHFEINLTQGDPSSARRLETRVLLNTSQGQQGFTYRWNTAETEAMLLAGRESETLSVVLPGGSTQDQLYEYPSRTDCTRCHTDAAGFGLSLKTAQLNGDFEYAGIVDNQLRSFNNIGLFDIDIGDADQYTAFTQISDLNATVDERARAYLDVNCSQCHQPNGPTPTTIDLRATTAQGAMNAIGVAPLAGTLGLPNAELIAVGDTESSVLWQRMQRLDNTRMPPLSSHVVDTEAVDLVGRWIDAL
jgi:uncharacterized repeat protein (TIGR03806 family)